MFLEQHIRMISEGSCDTEDWSNDAENTDLITEINYILISAVKWLIAINRIQNKSFCLHNIWVCTVYIYYVYINTNTYMYIFKKNMLCLYIKYIYI